MKTIIKYMKPYYRKMTLGLIIKSVGTVMDLFLPWILSHLIDNVVPTENITKIILFGALMLVISFLGWSGNVIANRMAAAVARDTTKALRHDLFTKTIHLSNKDIDDLTIPTLETRLSSDTYNVHQIIGMMQRMGIRAPVLLIGGVIMTFIMDPFLALIMLCMLPLIGFSILKISKNGIPLYKKQQESVDTMVRVTRENIQGIRVIKSLSREEYEKKKFACANADVAQKETKAGNIMAVTSPLMNLLLNIGLVIVIFIGAYRVSSGSSEVGTIIAFLTYFTIILNAMMAVNRIFMMYSKGSASAQRIGEILEYDDERNVIPTKTGISTDQSSHIRFRNVSFSYNGEKNDLDNISFDIKKGGTLGIIGGTGSGKSTVVSLLLNFYSHYSGDILIDGREIRSFDLKELRSRIGAVLQNDFIFTGTVMENIKLDRDIEDITAYNAASTAQAEDFIGHLHDKYSHNINSKGTNLSGGQRQRLLITRAIAGNPEVLILDDSCSALDYKTDSLLRKALDESPDSNTTKIIIAQRVSSIMNSDLIIVMDDGRIADMGSHDHLMKNCDIYRMISESQMGGTEGE